MKNILDAELEKMDKYHIKMFGKRGPKKHKIFKNLSSDFAEKLEDYFERSFWFIADMRPQKNKKWSVIVRRAPKDESVP